MRKILVLSSLIFVFIFSCKSSYQIQKNDAAFYILDESSGSVDEMETLIAPYRTKLAAEMSKEIGQLKTDLKKGRPESTLGNFTADAILYGAKKYTNKKIDFSLPNYGGMRVEYINAGPLTRGNIFELMPFDNTLVVLDIDGKGVKQLFDHITWLGGWPVSKNVSIVIDTLNRQNEYLIGGKEIEMDKTYSFCLSDYIANGGDDCTFLKELPRTDLNLLFRDALMEYVEDQTKDGKTIEAKLEGRSTFK